MKKKSSFLLVFTVVLGLLLCGCNKNAKQETASTNKQDRINENKEESNKIDSTDMVENNAHLGNTDISIPDHKDLTLAIERMDNINDYSYYVIRLYDQDTILDEYSLLDEKNPGKSYVYNASNMELYDYDNNGYPDFWIYDTSNVFKNYYLFTVSSDLKICLVESFYGADLITQPGENSFLLTTKKELGDTEIEQDYKYTYINGAWVGNHYETALNLDYDGINNDTIAIENDDIEFEEDNTVRPVTITVTLNNNIALQKVYQGRYKATVYTADFCKEGKEQVLVLLTDSTSNFHYSELYILDVINGELIETLTITEDSITQGLANNSEFFTNLYGNMPEEKRLNYNYLQDITIIPANETNNISIKLVMGYEGRDAFYTYIHWNGTEWSRNNNYVSYSESYKISEDSYTVTTTEY